MPALPRTIGAPAGSVRPSVLWVTNELPERDGGGGNIRQAHLLEAVARHFPTDLLAVGTVRDERVRGALRRVIELPLARDLTPQDPVGRRLSMLALTLLWREPFQAFPVIRARRRLARALEQAADADLVLVQQEALAPLVRARRGGRWIITLHHVLSAMAEQEERKAPGRRQRWMWRTEVGKARRFEAALLHDWDATVTCSEQDAAYLGSLLPDGASTEIAVVPNGVDVDRFAVTPVPADPVLLLPGTLDFAPNIDGAQWFCDEVLPLVQARVPAVTLRIAGRKPWPSVVRLAERPGITVVGDVPSMEPLFEAARVVLVPLRVGTGTRLKALEGLAASRPVVGTTIGLEGIDLTDGVDARITDEPVAMADAIVELLLDDAAAQAQAKAGRALVEARYSWDAIARAFVEWLETAANGGPDRPSALSQEAG